MLILFKSIINFILNNLIIISPKKKREQYYSIQITLQRKKVFNRQIFKFL